MKQVIFGSALIISGSIVLSRGNHNSITANVGLILIIAGAVFGILGLLRKDNDDA